MKPPTLMEAIEMWKKLPQSIKNKAKKAWGQWAELEWENAAERGKLTPEGWELLAKIRKQQEANK